MNDFIIKILDTKHFKATYHINLGLGLYRILHFFLLLFTGYRFSDTTFDSVINQFK